MPHIFHLHRESLKRKFAIYVVIAKWEERQELYIGKVGDNRDGCNPIISRCGNHFSYNEIHSQVRNKVLNHEAKDYVYVFEHFDNYVQNPDERRAAVERINEMERWLNQEIQVASREHSEIVLLNPYKGSGYLHKEERSKRAAFHTEEARVKIQATVEAVMRVCQEPEAGTPRC